MARKSVGYVHMEWTCPNCGTRNKGTDKVCTQCATAQPIDVEFEQVAQEELIEDEALIAKAKAGPDIHCPFCGTRNPATAVKCQNCFGDLTESVARQRGTVVGKHRTKPVPDIICDYCQTANPGTATTCSNCLRPLNKPQPTPKPKKATPKALPARRSKPPIWLYIILGAVVLGCGTLFFLSQQRSETVGSVTDVEWQRTIIVEGLVPVSRETWLDEVPSAAEVGMCRDEVRYTSQQPQPNSREVCGEPYTVDTGTGIGEIVQDCEYLVYDDFCTYTVDEWQVVGEYAESGVDFAPFWPALSLDATSEREAEQEERYEVILRGDGRSYAYHPRTLEEYLQFEIGSDWILEINGLNNVTDIRPR